MKKTIAVLPGDGIGPEVMTEALRVLERTAGIFGHTFEMHEAPAGGAAYERYGCHMPEETLSICRRADAILFGSVGGPVDGALLPKWKDCERNSILELRRAFSFAVNLRPVRIYSQVAHMSPLKPAVVEAGVDMLIVRELLGDCYFGRHEENGEIDNRSALDESTYTEEQIRTACLAAFQAARKRRSKVTSVDKANVLSTSRLWRRVANEVREDFPDVDFEDMLVDNCAMQLVRAPGQFDVIVTSNMFGDILSDLAAALPGSLGLCASASLSASGKGLYEPPGGSAQDIAGLGIANPIAQILSAAMMLRHSFAMSEEADLIEGSVEKALKEGYRTADIKSSDRTEKVVSTRDMADAVLALMAEAPAKSLTSTTSKGD
ncbi:MAG: 3-isopropylmalate dehydrogenase [Candidatus Obscuribacterales bacterium]